MAAFEGTSGVTGCCGFRNLNTRASFAACLMAASVTGCGYTFSVYSSALSEQFQLNDSQLNTLSAVYFSTGVFSWIPGLITDSKGPKFVVRWFGALEACALVLYWLVSRRYIEVGDKQAVIATLASISVVVYFGSAGIVGAVFSSLVRTHGARAGTMVGIAKGWVGICGGYVVLPCLHRVSVAALPRTLTHPTSNPSRRSLHSRRRPHIPLQRHGRSRRRKHHLSRRRTGRADTPQGGD